METACKKTAYRKTGTRDPSRTPAGPYKNRKIGTLAGPYKNRKTRTRDLSGTLKKPGINYNSISSKICKVNTNEMYMHFTNTFQSFHKTSG